MKCEQIQWQLLTVLLGCSIIISRKKINELQDVLSLECVVLLTHSHPSTKAVVEMFMFPKPLPGVNVLTLDL